MPRPRMQTAQSREMLRDRMPRTESDEGLKALHVWSRPHPKDDQDDREEEEGGDDDEALPNSKLLAA